MVIARMLIRGGLLTLALTAGWPQLKLFVGLCGHLLCPTPGLSERDPSQ